MKQSLNEFNTIIFDCDGVILNSNRIKTEAFYSTVLHFGKLAAEEMLEYHVNNGGISRYKKFEYFLTQIAPKYPQPEKNNSLNDLLREFKIYVGKKMLRAEIAEGIFELRSKVVYSNWIVVSGGDQEELRDVFLKLNIDHLFNIGIYGSPDDKETIIRREINAGKLIEPMLFIGDSKYDYEVSCKFGLDFLFLSSWTELENWEKWVKYKKIKYCNNLFSLL